MAYGFVYVMGHEHMPGLLKIGMTDRSPLQRRDELSSGTSIPSPFDLLFYIEVDGAKAVEMRLHRDLDEYRVSESREFFKVPAKTIYERLRAFKVEEDAPLAVTHKGDEYLSLEEFEESRKADTSGVCGFFSGEHEPCSSQS